MHQFAIHERRVLDDLSSWIARRLSEPARAPTDRFVDLPEITTSGVGVEVMWRALRDSVLSSAFPTDHPRYLAFVGGAPTPAAVIADAALSAAAVYGGSELEAGAVVDVERVAMRWLCDLAGLPLQAHGAFVSGGSAATLSALVAARHAHAMEDVVRPTPGVIVAGAAGHSSIDAAADIMGCIVVSAGHADRPLSRSDLDTLLADVPIEQLVAVVATAGATNTGAVDDLDEVADWCVEHEIWLHVDAAYGGAALLAARARPAFAGIEKADSVTIDPHKWLFTPIDCAAVLYRDPTLAREAHTQRAEYLEIVNDHAADNPSDYSVQLTRRPRGLPLWASLVANGTDAYVDAVEGCLAIADYAVKRIEASSHLEMVLEPQLSVVLFRRLGWDGDACVAWSERTRLSGDALVTTTSVRGEQVFRFCFVNPTTSTADVDLVLNSLECHAEPR